jgi:hypothetical protein
MERVIIFGFGSTGGYSAPRVAMGGWWYLTGAMVVLCRRDTVSSNKESYMYF